MQQSSLRNYDSTATFLTKWETQGGWYSIPT